MIILEEKINEYKNKLIEFANLIENMLDISIKGLVYKEKAWLLDIIEKDEPKANNFEIELEKFGTILIAQYGPVAKDLRTILMILKINNDLERIGDHIVNITESSQTLIAEPRIRPMADIAKMGDETIKMLRDSINAFIQENTELARQVCEKDSLIDGLTRKIIGDLVFLMSVSPRTIETALHLIRVAHNLERIADLSTNISEDVIFMVKGEIIKHKRQ